MNLSLFDIILLLGGTQGLFLALLLSRRKVSNQAASNYLLLLVFLVSILLFAKFCFRPKWMLSFAEVILLPDVVLYIIGPCMWLFVRSLLRLPVLTKMQLWLHSLPALIHVLLINTLIGQHLNGNWHFLNNTHILISFYVIEGTGIFSILFYLFKSYQLIPVDTDESLSITSTILSFLKTFFKVGLSLAICWGFSFFFHIVRFDPTYFFYDLFWTLVVFYVYWLAYVGLLRTEIFEITKLTKPISSDDQVIIQSIKNYMEQQQPFLEPSLKIGNLAEKLNIQSHELSRLINQGFGLSFFDFVNSYRIQAFIDLRNTSSVDRSILQLAYQSGFNSKSSFNRAFRKMNGLSPSQYFSQATTLAHKDQVDS